MIKYTIVLMLSLFPLLVWSQETMTKVINHGGLDRSYTLYIPANYTGETEVPLVMNFHGYASSATDQMVYGDFRYIADTAGFIIVHPQGSLFENVTHWNVGSWVAGSTADDVGFTEVMLDEIVAEFNIDQNRIYSTGMSNGGYFSFLLACELSDRIAAIASVTGTMTPVNFNQCDPQRSMPVLQMHGTNDQVVPYEGALWTRSVDDVLNFWVDHNNTDTEPITFDLPDINTNDGNTATFSRFDNGDNGSVVEHIKINGGMHTWPGTVFVTPGTNLDFLASDAIWQFFSRYDLSGLVTSSKELEITEDVEIFPNPTASIIHFKTIKGIGKAYQLISPTGKVVKENLVIEEITTIDVSDFERGIYVLKVGGKSQQIFIN